MSNHKIASSEEFLQMKGMLKAEMFFLCAESSAKKHEAVSNSSIWLSCWITAKSLHWPCIFYSEINIAVYIEESEFFLVLNWPT